MLAFILAFITFNEANYLKEKKLRGGDHAQGLILSVPFYFLPISIVHNSLFLLL